MISEKGNYARNTIAVLEKKGRQSKQKIWLDLAERLKKRRRGEIKINLWKLDTMAEKLKGKTVIVPGKVLGKGELTSEITIAAFGFSERAKKEIEKKGKFMTLKELVESETKPSEMVIIG